MDSLQRYIILMVIVISLFETSCRRPTRGPDPEPMVTSLTPTSPTISEGRDAYIYATTDKSIAISALNKDGSYHKTVSVEDSPEPVKHRRGGTAGKPEIELVIGGRPLQIYYVVWKSSNYEVAGISGSRSSNGATVLTYSPGTAIVTAGVGTIYGAAPRDSMSATVSVLSATAESMVLTLDNLRARLHEDFDEIHTVRDTLMVEAGEFMMLYPVIRDSSGVTLQRSGITWTSSDVTVAEILGRPDVDWLPEHLSGGTTEIHVKSPGGVTITASLGHLTARARIKATLPAPIPMPDSLSSEADTLEGRISQNYQRSFDANDLPDR